MLRYLLERIKQQPKSDDGDKQRTKPSSAPLAERLKQGRDSANLPA